MESSFAWPSWQPSRGRAQNLKVVAPFPIGGDVRFDYLRADPEMRRLYVSHANRVDVLDADTGAVLGNLAPMKRIHGIAIAPSRPAEDKCFGPGMLACLKEPNSELGRFLRRGCITAGADRAVVMFDGDPPKIIKVIGVLGMKPDALEYDPETRMIFFANV